MTIDSGRGRPGTAWSHKLVSGRSERLPLLGSVYTCYVDSVLHSIAIEDRDRVAVGNIDDGAIEDGSC